jgi:hypothetical protein
MRLLLSLALLLFCQAAAVKPPRGFNTYDAFTMNVNETEVSD